MPITFTAEEASEWTDQELADQFIVEMEIDPDLEGEAIKILTAEYEGRGLTYQDLVRIWDRKSD